MCNNKDNFLFMFIKKRKFFPKKCNFLVSNLDFDIANSFAIGLFLFLEEKEKKKERRKKIQIPSRARVTRRSLLLSEHTIQLKFYSFICVLKDLYLSLNNKVCNIVYSFIPPSKKFWTFLSKILVICF